MEKTHVLLVTFFSQSLRREPEVEVVTVTNNGSGRVGGDHCGRVVDAVGLAADPLREAHTAAHVPISVRSCCSSHSKLPLSEPIRPTQLQFKWLKGLARTWGWWALLGTVRRKGGNRDRLENWGC